MIVVLLIACANVATLLLSRAAVRSPELALRAALGADRRRLIGQALGEALPLAALGGAAGLGLAWIGSRVLPAVMPADAAPAESQLGIDSTVLAFTAAIAVATLVLFAAFPAIATARSDAATLLSTSRSTGPKGRTQRTRTLLVFVEVALALTLLVSAGLLTRSLQHLRAVDPGFDPAHVLELHLTLPEHRYQPPLATARSSRTSWRGSGRSRECRPLPLQRACCSHAVRRIGGRDL